MTKEKEKKKREKSCLCSVHINIEGDVMHPMLFSIENMVLTTHHPF